MKLGFIKGGAIPASGIYVLILELEKSGSYSIGKLGNLPFPAGFYAYVGSALNGLNARISRHLRPEKSLHWHIDYFLQYARIINVVYKELPKKRNITKLSLREECIIATSLESSPKYIKGFGCNDCRCHSHLFYSKKARFLEDKATKAMQSLE